MFHIITRTKTGAISVFSPLLPSWKGGHCCTSIILSYWCTDRLLIVGVHLIETHSTFAIQVYCAKTKSTKKHFYTFLLCPWCRAFIAHTHTTNGQWVAKRDGERTGERWRGRRKEMGNNRELPIFQVKNSKCPSPFLYSHPFILIFRNDCGMKCTTLTVWSGIYIRWPKSTQQSL